MKHQYFGDVNDYRKYGLLRALQAPGGLSLSVSWMLTPDDGGSDGKFRSYLQEPGRWRHYDEPLFDHLSAALSAGGSPSVAMIEHASILPRARFFSETVPDDRRARAAWSRRLVSSAAGADLVFLDPDNGLEIPSKPIGRKDSSKYAAWYEVERLWEAGSSVLVYQHFCREERAAFTSRLARELQSRTGAASVEVFATPHVLFLLASQSRHAHVFEEAIVSCLPKWRGQVSVSGLLSNNGIQQTIRRP